jgi:3-carboxy-cis,cis-muconate cycloisomerase
MLASALCHMAIETGLLGRTEIDEVREGGEAGRGGSSAMPQKSNPRSTEYVEGLSRAIQSKAAGLYAILGQSNERNGGIWIAEWPLVPEHFLLSSAALRHANELIAGLVINKARMLSNLDLDGGAIMSEAFAGALAPSLGRTAAYDAVKTAVEQARSQNRSLSAVITDAPEVSGKLTKEEIEGLLDPSHHVGLPQSWLSLHAQMPSDVFSVFHNVNSRTTSETLVLQYPNSAAARKTASPGGGFRQRQCDADTV